MLMADAARPAEQLLKREARAVRAAAAALVRRREYLRMSSAVRARGGEPLPPLHPTGEPGPVPVQAAFRAEWEASTAGPQPVLADLRAAAAFRKADFRSASARKRHRPSAGILLFECVIFSASNRCDP